MSVSLLNHMEFPRDAESQGLPGVGDTVDGEVMWTSGYDSSGSKGYAHGYCGNPYASIYGLPAQKLFAAGKNGKIMCVRHYGGTFDFSDDYGASGYVTRVMPDAGVDLYDQGRYIQDIQYRESDDTWFVVWMYDVIQLAAQQRRGHLYYSQDDGLTWARTDSSSYHRDLYKCIVMQNGDIMTHAYHYYGSNTNNIIALTNAGYSDDMTVYDLGTSSGVYTRFSMEIAGGYLLTHVPTHGLIAAHPGATGYTQINGGVVPAGHAVGSAANPNGAALMVDTVVGNTVNYNRITLGTFTSGSITVVNAMNGWSFGYGGGKYIFVAGVASDVDLMEVWVSSDGTDGSWSGPYYWNVVTAKQSSTGGSNQAYFENQFHLRYLGGGYWAVGFYSTSVARMNAVKVRFGEDVNLPSQYGPLRSAINSQAPDIFFRMDDLGSPISVLDDGRKGYSNAAYGSLTFEEAGLVADDGTSVLVESADDTGVVVDAVPAPTDHAHVFVLKHDGTAAFRILASSGNLIAGNGDDLSYYISLALDNKVGIHTYFNGEWLVTYSLSAIPADTTTLMAVQIKPDGAASIYINDGLDVTRINVAIKEISATTLSILGGWQGGSGSTLQAGAIGVTLDYYALIPGASFNYQLINDSQGGTYVPPEVGGADDKAEAGSVAFLMHADEPELSGPFASERVPGKIFYKLVNSVPGSTGSINRISTETSEGRLSIDGKFGAGSAKITPDHLTSARWNPFGGVYWPITNTTPQRRGVPEVTLGVMDFTFDAWVKPLGGAFYLCSNNWITRSGSGWKEFGGITVVVFPRSAGTVQVDIRIYGSRSAPGLLLTLSHADVGGFVSDEWNHFAICRKDGKWHVFVGGNKAGAARRRPVSQSSDLYVQEGSSFMLGMHVYTAGTSYGRTQSNILIDEARLVLGQGLFTESFTPPSGPYSY